MDFPTLFKILKTHLSNGYSVPEFFSELIQMITDEEIDYIMNEVGVTKGKTEETLISYSKRGMSKKMASQILYYLKSENMTDSLSTRSDDCLKSLANELSKYFSDIDYQNVIYRVPEILTDMIRQKAGVTPASPIQKNNLIAQSATLKAQYGQALLIEANNRCTFSCCDTLLVKTKNGLSHDSYEISKIEKDKNADFNNLVVLCPDCFLTYQNDNNKTTTKQLSAMKKLLMSSLSSKQAISDIKLEESIVAVITHMNKLKYSDFDVSLDPKELTDKISFQKNRVLYLSVKEKVIENYVTLNKIFIHLDKQGKIDYEEIQSQMRSMYKKLVKAKKDSLEIFNTISEKIHSATLQDIYYCQMIVSFFIQKCEVLE